ncbi:MAG: type II toxin-antitoxin system VapC family toxin [Acidobacteria bacterium]|nr:type II toxin-antitoxin system VapC family toxin [Acidobacteriota bacterium]
MAGYFLDTSALGKRYHVEVGTPEVEHIFQESSAEIYISRLAVVDLHSAFALKVRKQTISEPDFHNLMSLFQTDVAKRIIQVIRVKSLHFQEAEELISKSMH